jgi:hypothetical protein
MEYLVANSVSELVKRDDLSGLTKNDKIIIGTSVSLGVLSIILAILTYLRFRYLYSRPRQQPLSCFRYDHNTRIFDTTTPTSTFTKNMHTRTRSQYYINDDGLGFDGDFEEFAAIEMASTAIEPSPEFFLPSRVSQPPQAISFYNEQRLFSTLGTNSSDNNSNSEIAVASTSASAINVVPMVTAATPQNSSRTSSIRQRERTITVNINKDKKDF